MIAVQPFSSHHHSKQMKNGLSVFPSNMPLRLGLRIKTREAYIPVLMSQDISMIGSSQ
jgi:glucose-6-phosphate-specific signal transduction histidine kinase